MSENRVLVIEDDELARQALVQQLRLLGMTFIDEAVDGDSARRALEGVSQYELIIADLMLPGHDAVELLRATAGRQVRAGLILISALGDSLLRSVAVLCRERGLRVLGALRKPIRPEALAQLACKPTRGDSNPALQPSRAPNLRDLQRVLEVRALQAMVQPVVSAVDGSLVAVEVLAHWDDPSLGQVPAARLARLADDNGLGSKLMQYMIGLALRTCAEWRSYGLLVPVSVNVGNGVLQDLQFPEYLDRMLKTLQLQPELLTLEVGESALLDRSETLDVLSRMRMRGVRTALDNFGRGQTSASRVQRLPVSELKIDRSYIRGLPDGVIAGAVVEYAVRLARCLGIETTAVGIETPEQAQAATAMGCSRLQGYWVGRPMRPDELPEWARTRPSGSVTAATSESESAPPVAVNVESAASPALS